MVNDTFVVAYFSIQYTAAHTQWKEFITTIKFMNKHFGRHYYHVTSYHKEMLHLVQATSVRESK